MGISASVSGNVRSSSGTCLFVDDTLLNDEMTLRIDPALRIKFIEFVKEGAWADFLDIFEENLGSSYDPSGSAWKRFGYKPPYCSAPSSSSFRSVTRNSSTVDCQVEAASTQNSIYQEAVIEDCYRDINSCGLFEKNELRPFLIAALLPLFRQSFEDRYNDSNSNDNTVVEGYKPLQDHWSHVSVKKSTGLGARKRERLQALLLGAAAMFDSSDLDSYLANSNVSWTEEYRKAILNLPVAVNVSTVDSTAQESKIVYSNVEQTGYYGIKSNLLGEDLHEVFSAHCSPGGVEQVAKAVFSARKYKRSVLGANNMCQLRALKPVFNTHGKHTYMVGVESRPFKDPDMPNSSGLDDSERNEKAFEQVEDVLLLLPMLIRTM